MDFVSLNRKQNNNKKCLNKTTTKLLYLWVDELGDGVLHVRHLRRARQLKRNKAHPQTQRAHERNYRLALHNVLPHL